MAKLRMIVDGWSSSNVGFGVFSADSRRTSPPREWVTETVSQRPERALMAPEPEYGRRRLRVSGHLAASNSTEFDSRRNELLARMDRRSEVEISFSDSTDLTFFARLSAATHEHLTKRSLADDKVDIEFELVRPWKYDKTTTVTTGISTGAVAIALGTAPTRDVTLRLDGPFTNPSIVYENSTGGTEKTLSFTLSKSSGEWLEIDMDAATIVDESSNSQQDKRDTGTDFPFALDPRDGQFWTSSWPRLRTTSGTLKATVRKAYF